MTLLPTVDLVIDKTNPLISAQLRQLRWEVPIAWPNSRNDFAGDSRPNVKKWVDNYLKETWYNEETRRQIVEACLEEFFGPVI